MNTENQVATERDRHQRAKVNLTNRHTSPRAANPAQRQRPILSLRMA